MQEKNLNSNLKAKLLPLILIIGSGLVLHFWHVHKKETDHRRIIRSYFYPVKIVDFSAGNIPIIEISSQGKKALVKFDSGTCEISLFPEFLAHLEKKFIHNEISYGIRGKKYESIIYELPKITIGDITISPINVKEANLEFEEDTILVRQEPKVSQSHLGRIGWAPFYQFNVVLDCKHSILAFCDSLNTLKENGYPIDEWVEVPFELDRGFIEFDAAIDTGALRCILDTGSTCCLLNKTLDGSSNDHMIFNPMHIDLKHFEKSNPHNEDIMVFDVNDRYEASSFKLGQKDFGPIYFRRIKTPGQIDAILGMNFVDSSLIFIDFANRKIYFHDYPVEIENPSSFDS